MTKKAVKKKKIWCFYRINFSLIILASILLFYFLVLVSMGAKSVQFVTDKIENHLQEKFGSNSSIQNSYINFTTYGSLKVSAVGLNIFYGQSNEKKEFFTIPKAEAEFSLLNFLLFDFTPRKIKVSNPLITINDIENLKSSKEEIANSEGQIGAIFEILQTIGSKNLIKNFEIENAKFIFFKKDKTRQEILLRSAKIKSDFQGENLKITAQNIVNFDVNKSDVNLDSSCIISALREINCDLFLNNFIPNSISNLHAKLNNLEKIQAAFDASFSIKIKDKILKTALFKFNSSGGKINFDGFFNKEINFKNLEISGNYDERLNILNISKINSEFVNLPSKFRHISQKPSLSMSVLVSNLNLPQKKSEFSINLSNILVANLDEFWPAHLKNFASSKWVLENIKDGLVSSAYAKFSLIHESETNLENLDAKVIFSDVNLAYSSYFPEIKNISGIANFSENSMKIDILNAQVASSKLSNSKVEIFDFSAPKILLNIAGKLEGSALDVMRHINNSTDFISPLENNFTGKASSDFQVALNLSDNEISLKSVALNINSKLENIESKYLKGGVELKVEKKFLTKKFVISSDFSESEFAFKAFDLNKKLGVASFLDLEILVGDGALKLNKISFNKNENNAKISGNLALNLNPFLPTAANIKNRNFGKNYFSLVYAQNKNLKKLKINGAKLNFGALLEEKFFSKFSDSGKQNLNLDVDISLSRLELLNGKVLRQFKLNFDCLEGLCAKGEMSANYFNKENLNLLIAKNAKENFSIISGKISEISYLADGFGISNLVKGGDAKIKIKNSASQQKTPIFEGKIEVKRDITVFEDERVKKFYKDNLFSKVKDKVFSSGKITFDSVKIEFEAQDGIFNLNSLIANNYKIGITAKGSFNLKENSFQIKGMIIPGFLINNLFGIGNIPLLGGVISGVLTGGEGGGVFGLRYNYVKNKGDKEAQFLTNKVAAFVPSTLQNLFD
jgi:hypothetical protein